MPYPVSAIKTAAQVPEIVALMARFTGVRKQELYHKSRWKSRFNAPELQLFSSGNAMLHQDLPIRGEPERATHADSGVPTAHATIQSDGLGTQTCHCAKVLA
jgi:hypothetical protein